MAAGFSQAGVRPVQVQVAMLGLAVVGLVVAVAIVLTVPVEL
jgi:hypothetical protein